MTGANVDDIWIKVIFPVCKWSYGNPDKIIGYLLNQWDTKSHPGP